MDLDIDKTFNPRLVTPYIFNERAYYLLFFRQGVVGPFYVADSPYSLEGAMLNVGEVRQKATDIVVGNIFYSQYKVKCGGSYLVAYSGVFKESLATSIPKDFSMDLMLKTPYMHIFNRKNRATLVISPNLKTNIRENLEI
jgi:hypothetical protein